MSEIPAGNALHQIIAPEVRGDELYFLIEKLCAQEKLTHVLEIGSSSGGGSTEAFVRGLSRNTGEPRLYCMEISKPRFEKLRATYEDKGFVHCYNVSSVGADAFPDEAEVARFYHEKPSGLRHYPLEQVQQWRRDDLAYLAGSGVPDNGIEIIQEQNGIEQFDLVFIDGSEFTGSAELDRVYGARLILLDDAHNYKTWECRERLLNDPNYELVAENLHLRNGYACFRRKDSEPLRDALPVHFFTIVLNGKPFIDYHIEMMRQLDFPWVWHIVEGVAELNHDTGWSRNNGGQIPTDLHREGRSVDGTSEYLDALAAAFPENIRIYRKERGQFWDGKREMVNAPLPHIPGEALLWEIDADELWSAAQVTEMRRLFLANPQKTAAQFWCWFFFGPDRIVSTRHCYSQNPNQEWRRVWRFQPGMSWARHEPPVLALTGSDGQPVDVARVCPFTHDETEAAGLVFQHYAYTTPEQARFKELYYGYKGAVDAWESLQNAATPARVSRFIPWVHDHTEVDHPERFRVEPIATVHEGEWSFDTQRPLSRPQGSGQSTIVIDGVFFQYYRTGIARVWTALFKEWSGTDFGARLLVLDRDNTCPRVPGLRYRTIPRHDYNKREQDQRMLEQICQEESARAFISTYYSFPSETPAVMMVHDMTPEILGMNREDPMWQEKHELIARARHFVCVSENTARDLCRLFPGVKPESLTVAHNGLEPHFQPQSSEAIERFKHRYGIRRPYFLLIGGRNGYKNGRAFFEAFAQLPYSELFDIVCTGPQSHDEELRDLTAGSNVVCARLDEDQLTAAYSGAVALVVPSLYEGFGMPVAEAMACGCPVVCSNTSSLPEVAGGAALLIDPHQPGEIADALCDVLKPVVRRNMIAKGRQRAEDFSWQQTAERIREVLCNIADAQQAASPQIDERLAHQLLQAGHVAEAVQAYDLLAQADPGNLSLLNDRSVAYFKLGQQTGNAEHIKAAVSQLRDLTEIRPDFVNGWKNLAAISRAIGDHATVQHCAEHILAVSPEDPQAKQLLAAC